MFCVDYPRYTRVKNTKHTNCSTFNAVLRNLTESARIPHIYLNFPLKTYNQPAIEIASVVSKSAHATLYIGIWHNASDLYKAFTITTRDCCMECGRDPTLHAVQIYLFI